MALLWLYEGYVRPHPKETLTSRKGVPALKRWGVEMAARVHVLVFEGFADWEPAHALAELRRSGHHDVVAVGFTPETVTSMGGLRVLPDRAVADVRGEDVRILIVPGGEVWEDEDAYPRVAFEELLGRVMTAGRPIAAILRTRPYPPQTNGKAERYIQTALREWA